MPGRIGIASQSGAYTVCVSAAFPRTAEMLAARGYGLHLVDRIADEWGVQHASMHVWFDLSY